MRPQKAPGSAPRGRPPLKRRRTSSVASSKIDEEESDSQNAEPARKRKKFDPSELVQQLYDSIRNHKKDDGSLLCDAFIRVPKRRQEPGYYEVVTNPIDLLKVQQKVKTDEYEDLDELQTDIELLVNNAKAFYKRTSQEYKDACELWELFLSNKNKLVDEPKVADEPSDGKGKIILKARKAAAAAAAEAKKQDMDTEDTSESSTMEEELGYCEDLFIAVMTATDADNRPLHLVFQLLPSKKRYPKYYEVIDNPIDLRTIARKIQDSKYTTLNDMEKDLLLMTRNACTFNEPGSQIYKDAKALRKVITSKKIEIEHGKFGPGKSSERIRNKRLRGGQSMSAITAALLDEDEDSDDEIIDADAEDADNPRWQLYQAVKTASNAQGQELSEPFWKLPSKRYYPDYYKEIRNPLSLMQIGKKLKRGDYGTVSEVAGDMNIMFENAKKYNRADSRLYKDAVKLQKLMQAKVQELLELDHQYSDSEDDSADDQPQQPVIKQQTAKSTRCLTRGKYLNNIPLKRRLYTLCKCLIEHVCEDGRQPMLMFMEKPSKKLYPDYYKVIDNPVDMLTIEANIKAEKYASEDEILSDFKLMFANCRKYNEETSMIYNDAIKLEKILLDRVKELGPLPDPPPRKTTLRTITPKVKRMAASSSTPVSTPPPSGSCPTKELTKMRALFSTIRDYKDPKNRQLSMIFTKLPSKVEYPDYYEVIKKPINMEHIAQKLKLCLYDSLDELVSEFVLMFDNACKYNEPDSQIYKDALMLQRVCLQTKLQLKTSEDTVPDVTAAVQELLTSLFIAVYNHQDEEGRCFSDSMQELPEHDDVDGKKVRALSLDVIKRRLDSGQYRRLDLFQEDLFSCMERARRLSRTDSQVFEDSVELQSFFIRQRDELCRNGDLLHSPALNYTLLDLSTAVDHHRQQKLLQEQPDQPDDENETRSSEDASRDAPSCSGPAVGTADNALSYNQQVYRIGDFIYAESKERGMEPIILNIQRLWTNQEGQQMLYGNQFYRPRETYHVTTRKFLENEVFKTDQHVAIPLNQVLGRCCVLNVKDYFRFKPDSFEEKDVYVCESRYSSKARAFKKIKNWPVSLSNAYKLSPRDEVLEPKRVVSVFRERVEKHKEEIAELEEKEKLVEKDKPNLVVQTSDEGWTYYEQYNTNTCLIKTGDCVYVKTEAGSKLITQVDTIWTNADGESFIHGPWLVLPSVIPHTPSRTFYKQEVFLSTLEDTNPVNNILGKCAVLEHSEYISCRPTEIREYDVYVCESMYDEAKRTVKELPRDGLKKYTHTPAVTQDEIYFFRRLINPPKITGDLMQGHDVKPPQFLQHDQNSSVASPLLPKVEADMLCDDSMDGGPPSVGSGDIKGDGLILNTPLTSKKSKKGNKLVTGYILYSSDVRRNVTANHPNSNFGEVSRIVGNEWRNLPANEKMIWEEKAARMNEETVAKMAEADLCPSPAPPTPTNPHPDLVYECCWDNCDWQFEDMSDCIEHAVAEGCGHVHMYFAAVPPHELEFQCQWRGCTRMRKANLLPFPNLHRLARHVKEVHILKSTGKVVPNDQRSKNLMPSRTKSQTVNKNFTSNPLPGIALHAASMAPGLMTSSSRNTPSPLSQNGGSASGSTGRGVEPLFVTVPPRPQRLLHSEAYIRYIEGLNSESRNISNWDKQLRATQLNTELPDISRVPGYWLGNGAGNHGNILNALWTLRDFMFRDALGISKLT
uniref:Protein polybromo-1 n=1 Tax=Clastoptera arizonana TaxID=38151 RepID=A0A1B6CN38_9HEMI